MIHTSSSSIYDIRLQDWRTRAVSSYTAVLLYIGTLQRALDPTDGIFMTTSLAWLKSARGWKSAFSSWDIGGLSTVTDEPRPPISWLRNKSRVCFSTTAYIESGGNKAILGTILLESSIAILNHRINDVLCRHSFCKHIELGNIFTFFWHNYCVQHHFFARLLNWRPGVSSKLNYLHTLYEFESVEMGLAGWWL